MKNAGLVAIAALARTTLAEAIRDRILYGLLAFGVGLILLSAVLSNLTLGYRLRIVTDLSMTAVTFAGVAIALLLGAGSIAREVDRRLVFGVLAKPIRRGRYLLGKFAGVVLTAWLNVLLMAAAATVLVVLYAEAEEGGRLFSWGDYAAQLGLTLLRIALVAGIAVAFSAFTSSTVALIAAGGLALAGYFSADLRFFLGQSESPATRWLGEALFWALPDLAALDPLPRLIHGQPILTGDVAWAGLYACAYVGAMLVLASWLFSRRDLG